MVEYDSSRTVKTDKLPVSFRETYVCGKATKKSGIVQTRGGSFWEELKLRRGTCGLLWHCQKLFPKLGVIHDYLFHYHLDA